MGRAIFVVSICFLAITTAAVAVDQPARPTPIVRSVGPSPAKAGQEVAASGQYLSKEFVASAYLTLGDNTYEVEIKSQSDEKITFKVPGILKPGKFGLMLLTNGDVPRYLDEPVYLQVE